MLSDADPNSAYWTIATLVILFGLIPAVLFLLGRAATVGTTPDKEQMKEVRRLAVEIGQGAENLLTEGSRVFTGASGERFVLDVFIRFADSADQFRMMALDLERSPSRVRSAFRELIIDFERALAAYPALKAYRAGQERLEKLGRYMEELKRLYDAQPIEPVNARASGTRGKAPTAITQSSNNLDPPLS
jgi:hypothetical protein